MAYNACIGHPYLILILLYINSELLELSDYSLRQNVQWFTFHFRMSSRLARKVLATSKCEVAYPILLWVS